MSADETRSKILGAWRLISCEHRLTSGKVHYPLGKTASGLLIYNQDGFMSVSLMKASRPLFRTAGLFEGSNSEKAGAAESYVSYGGRYDLQRDKVVHHVEVSLFPNWVGTAQERFFKFENDHLLLYTPAFMMNGEEQVAYLVWERSKGNS